MRIRMRDVLDTDSPVNLKKLKPSMKIYAGVTVMYHSTDYYKRKVHKKMEAAEVQRMQQDENLKELLLARIMRELNFNKTLAEKDEVCQSMIVSVDASQIFSLKRILKHSDFLPYDCELVEENPDFRLAFKNMPYLLKISKRVVE